jgi:hypothetical protein
MEPRTPRPGLRAKRAIGSLADVDNSRSRGQLKNSCGRIAARYDTRRFAPRGGLGVRPSIGNSGDVFADVFVAGSG